MTVVERDALIPQIRRQQAAAIREWGKHRSLQRFLADHYPEEWDSIRTCRTGYYKTYQNQDVETLFKANAVACHKLPFCIMCVRAEAARRTRKVQDKFAVCTPAGKQPRFVHIVQVAPIYADGTGWGTAASKNITAFGKIVFEALKETYGEGIGAVLSYQDFGERGFAKRHPHMDLTLNGWMLQDGKPVPTPRIQLVGSGRRKWDERIVARAQSLQLGAERGSCDFGVPRKGFRAYAGILKYQLREMVDLTKLRYSRDDQVIWWRDSKRGTETRIACQDFRAGLEDYRQRLGVWGAKPAQNLHKGYGHMAKGSINKTKQIMGGSPLKHREACPCATCGDWDRVFLDEVEEALQEREPLPERP
jgi:hypothetical protein